MISKKALEATRKDYSLFIEHIIGEKTLEDHQRRLCQAVAKHQRVSCRACHSAGKTWTLARIVLAFGSLFISSKSITTAPTHRQVERLLWGEINQAHKRSKVNLGGKMTLTAWNIDADHWAIGFAPKQEIQKADGEQVGSTFQGIHSPTGILIVFDEATGIRRDVWAMAEGMMTSGAVVRFVAIGNPTTRDSEFFKTFDDPQWFNLHFSCFDSPNMKANGFTDMEAVKAEILKLKMLSKTERLEHMLKYKIVSNFFLRADWAIGYILKLGFEHPLVVSKVFGEFPTENTRGLFNLSMVEEAKNRNDDTPAIGERLIGVDVARFGTDNSIFTELVGWKSTRKHLYSKFDVSALAGELIQFARHNNDKYEKTRIIIDGTGIGAGVVDALNEYVSIYNLDWEIIEIHFGGEPIDKEHFVNKKSEMFSLLSQDLRLKLGLLDDDIYGEELPTIMHFFDSKGKTRIESKDDFKRRTGRDSPDASDSLAMANYGRYIIEKAGNFPKPSDMKRIEIKAAVY